MRQKKTMFVVSLVVLVLALPLVVYLLRPLAAPVAAKQASGSGNERVVVPATAAILPVTSPVAAPSVATPTIDSHVAVLRDLKPSPATIEAVRAVREPEQGEGQVVQYPDGSEEFSLGNSHQSVAVVMRDKNDKIHVDYHGEKYLSPEQKPLQKEPPQ